MAETRCTKRAGSNRVIREVDWTIEREYLGGVTNAAQNRAVSLAYPKAGCKTLMFPSEFYWGGGLLDSGPARESHSQ